MQPKNVRIKDIARLSGVSVGTVDRVLHDRGRVSDKARKKVLSVLDKIDYKPNLIARTLGAHKTYRLAVLIPDPGQDPYWASARAGVEQASAEWLRYGVNIVPSFFDLYDRNSFRQVAEAVAGDGPDGILVAPIFYHEALPFFDRFRDAGIPFVLFNTNIEETPALSFIGQDLYQSGMLGGELMDFSLRGDAGALAVLHINEDPANSVHLAEKERGFREYFGRRRAPGEIITRILNATGRETIGARIGALMHEKDITGIFVTTSAGTYLVASCLAQLRREKIGLIGYDMLEENIRFLRQGIINFLIHQNPRRQAFLGISHLAGQLILNRQAPKRDLLPLEIISRENIDSYLRSGDH